MLDPLEQSLVLQPCETTTNLFSPVASLAVTSSLFKKKEKTEIRGWNLGFSRARNNLVAREKRSFERLFDKRNTLHLPGVSRAGSSKRKSRRERDRNEEEVNTEERLATRRNEEEKTREDGPWDEDEKKRRLQPGRLALRAFKSEKKRNDDSELITVRTNSERSARDANDGQMKHKVRAASPSFSSLYPRTCTCACADRPLKLRPLSVPWSVRHQPPRALASFLRIDASFSNRDFFPYFSTVLRFQKRRCQGRLMHVRVVRVLSVAWRMGLIDYENVDWVCLAALQLC